MKTPQNKSLLSRRNKNQNIIDFDNFTPLSEYILSLKNDTNSFKALRSALISSKIKVGFLIPNTSTKKMFCIPGRIWRKKVNFEKLGVFFDGECSDLLIDINGIGAILLNELNAVSGALISGIIFKKQLFVTSRYFEKLRANETIEGGLNNYHSDVDAIKDAFISHSAHLVEPMIENPDVEHINRLVQGRLGRKASPLPSEFYEFVVKTINSFYRENGKFISQKALKIAVKDNIFKYPGSQTNIGDNLKYDKSVIIWKLYKDLFKKNDK